MGPSGPSGTAGDDGEDGNTVLNDDGPPGSGDGSRGDFYIDTDSWEIYGPKTGSGWGSSGLYGDSECNTGCGLPWPLPACAST